jgi:hypothetical protein
LNEDKFEEMARVLKDIIPYCSDLEFVRMEYEMAIGSNDPLDYLEARIENESGSRRADLRILLNRLTRKSR